MYKITWDKETGGVLLHSRIVEGTLGVSPRPVFFEELDLLKLNELGWKYPNVEEPLMWAVNKQYWYQGELMFEAKGANIYDAATVVFQSGREKMTLKPVDVKKMLAKNHDFMFLLESEAIEFIRETFSQYAGARKSVERIAANQMDYEALAKRMEKKTKQKMAIVKEDCDSFEIMPLNAAEKQGKKVFHTTKIDKFLASFSGGKDSQVVLDLCTRAIPSTEFEVIYSDTGYELPPSLKLYEQVQEHYQKLFPDLKFSIARNHESVLNYWDKIGTPSDTHRWCCSVMKTGPLYRMMKVEGTNKQAKVLTFEGVRAEESTRRSGYGRIGRGVKHSTTINARPILHWSVVETFLYIFEHKLPINVAYRQGMTRVGCLLCPFASEWNEMIARKIYPESVEPFDHRLRIFADKAGVRDVDEYIKQGGWKRRASGNLIQKKSSICFTNNASTFIAIIDNPSVDICSYLWTIGEFQTTVKKECIYGELKVAKNIYTFTINPNHSRENSYIFTIKDIKDVILISYLKRALYKSTYCIHCEVCEVECPTGALKVFPEIFIDKNLCVHCMKCLDFHDKGCVVANSVSSTTNINMSTTTGKMPNIDRYKNFGLKEEWLEMFLIELDNYWDGPHGLNVNYQIPSLKSWLKDAELIDDKGKSTELAKLLSSIREDNPELIWQIVWINLSYNSFIINWFINNVSIGSQYSAKELEENIVNQFPVYKPKTVHNAVYQLQRTLKESPIGETFSQCEEIDKYNFMRNAFSNLNEIALAYSLYRYSEAKGIYSLRVADLYRNECASGPYKEFGIPQSIFEKLLRTLNSTTNRVLIAELNMGLDSITLRDDLSSFSCLKQLLEL